MKKLVDYISEGFGSKLIEREILIKGISCNVLEGNGPFKNIHSFSTLGVSRYPLKNLKGHELPFGVEIISAVHPIEPSVFDYPGILAAVAFQFTQNYAMSIGNVVVDVVKNMYPVLKDKPHLYLTFPPGPGYWKHDFDDLLIGTKNIKFLCGFPISVQEYSLLKEKGREYFEDYLDQNEIDIFNSKRQSELLS
ncbi:suppressor of fused domain protein [Rhodocytophaga aerolata]|uniref:Suppressor of fused domain protein n=1 Tax=Rhodocytophaga aerolata TaxID=455078 RepID=A0ABT8RD36_9BACT|nr:suppressor of fused domain protein [Rhodocytophaga aerolata]MDO1449113.1 suppressor of fused domain protein [Rhodocytophaga aerolata]